MANRGRFVHEMERASGLMWSNLLLGGLSFWLPDVARDFVERSEITLSGILVLTVIMPLAAALAYMARRTYKKNRNQSVALSMLLGIWVLGPTMIVIGQTFFGGGFKFGVGSTIIFIVWTTLLPIYFLMLAGFDFSILALLLVTGMFIVLHRVYEKGRPLLPPRKTLGDLSTRTSSA